MKIVAMRLFVVAALLGCTQANAQNVTVVRHLSGYVCMSLDPASEAATNQSQLPPVLAEPSKTAARIGYPTGVVLVKAPIREVNGFVEMIRMNGQTGWISTQHVQPWHSASGGPAKCRPAVLSNGRIGTDIQ
jgi:hypothetical protein